MTLAPIPDAAFERGWRVVAVVLGWLVSLFGTPGELATRVLSRRLVRLARRWLALAERMARGLVFTMAAQAPASNAPPRGRGRMGPSSGYGRGGFAGADSSRWGVRYRFLGSPAARKAKSAPTRRRRTARLPDALPLAERLEALIRVAADPARFAARLARRRPRPPALPSVAAIVSRPDLVERLFESLPARPPWRGSG